MFHTSGRTRNEEETWRFKAPVYSLPAAQSGSVRRLRKEDCDSLLAVEEGSIRLREKSVSYEGRQAPAEARHNTLRVPRGGEYAVTLSDGTEVRLNSESELRYPVAFGDGERRVYLKGEGYFRVARDEARPFLVEAGGAAVRVLGTSFDVKAYPDDRMIVTTLVTGKIAQRYAAADTGIVLTPSRQSVYDRESGSLRTREVDPRDALAWREGRIVMKDARLEDIFRELSRWYDFEAVYTNPSLRDMRFYLHTNRYAEIDGILEHLQATRGVRFSRVGNKIYVSR